MSQTNRPITERSNVITKGIDSEDAEGIIRRFEHCDKEIFEGWQSYQCLYAGQHLRTMNSIANVAASMLKDPSRNAVVLGGAGTSGRLAFLTARSFNRLCEKLEMEQCYDYSIAGGDRCLFSLESRDEAEEDSPQMGADSLEQLTWGKSRVLYIGLTCSVSSPWVAGQLDHCIKNLDKYIPVLIGFNPVKFVSTTKIAEWTKSVKDVVTALEGLSKKDQGYILNPVIGPEPLAGLSCMKGGTTTKILLDSLLMKGHHINAQDSSLYVAETLRGYESLCRLTYKKKYDIAPLGEACAESLRVGGHVYYIGEGSLGIIGMIDAAEWTTSFGTDPDQIRAFIHGGYKILKNHDGDMSGSGHSYQLSVDDFKDDYLETLTSDDLVIILSQDGDISGLEDVFTSPVKIAMLNMMSSRQEMIKLYIAARCTCFVQVQVHDDQLFGNHGKVLEKYFLQLQEELVCKWVVNLATATAHILLDKVYKNYMVSFKTSNVKLFNRAKRLIKDLSQCSDTDAWSYLVRAIYGVDALDPLIITAMVTDHVEQAEEVENVVPIALLLAIGKCSISEAKQKLEEVDNIRSAIEMCLEARSCKEKQENFI